MSKKALGNNTNVNLKEHEIEKIEESISIPRTNDSGVQHNIETLQTILKESNLNLTINLQIKQAIKGLQDLLDLREASRNLINAATDYDEEEFNKLGELLENTQ